MKNIKGEEIFTTRKEKKEFYNSQATFSMPREHTFYNWIPRKDDHIIYTLIPYLKKYGVKSVLDIGAKVGKYSARFYDNGFEDVTAVEVSQELTDHLRKVLDKFGYDKIKTKCFDIDYDAIPRDYDLIFLSDVLEHLEDFFQDLIYCLEHAKYVFVLVPKGLSWDWSNDHVSSFDDEDMSVLMRQGRELVYCDVIEYDKRNSWYALLMKGFA